jgi:hypothetical protein
MVAVIDPLSGVVSMVDTLLTRLDAREAKLKERMDVLDALIDLLHVLRAWLEAAAQTDEALSFWLKTPQSPEARELLRIARVAQGVHMEEAHSTFRPPPRSRKDVRPAKASLSDLLYVYAPEFEAEFAKVLGERKKVLASLERDRPGFVKRWAAALAPGAASPYAKEAAKVDLRAFRQATSNLHRITRQLADFIATRFEPKDVRVRS